MGKREIAKEVADPGQGEKGKSKKKKKSNGFEKARKKAGNRVCGKGLDFNKKAQRQASHRNRRWLKSLTEDGIHFLWRGDGKVKKNKTESMFRRQWTHGKCFNI